MGTPTVNITELTNVIVNTDMKLFAGSVFVQNGNQAKTILQYFAAEDVTKAEKVSMQRALKLCPVDEGYYNHTPQVMEIDTEFILSVLMGKITKDIQP